MRPHGHASRGTLSHALSFFATEHGTTSRWNGGVCAWRFAAIFEGMLAIRVDTHANDWADRLSRGDSPRVLEEAAMQGWATCSPPIAAGDWDALRRTLGLATKALGVDAPAGRP